MRFPALIIFHITGAEFLSLPGRVGRCIRHGSQFTAIRPFFSAPVFAAVIEDALFFPTRKLAGIRFLKIPVLKTELPDCFIILMRNCHRRLTGIQIDYRLAGVFLLQVPNMRQMKLETMALTLIPILIAAFSYPLGNRKVMSLVSSDISTLERVYAMTLCSLPVWIFLSIWAFITHGLPGRDQLIQSFFVALFSGTAATVLFFKATDMVKHNHKWLAVIEATQSGEVIFTLLGGNLFLKDPVPSAIGLAGIAIIVAGMTGNSLCQ